MTCLTLRRQDSFGGLRVCTPESDCCFKPELRASVRVLAGDDPCRRYRLAYRHHRRTPLTLCGAAHDHESWYLRDVAQVPCRRSGWRLVKAKATRRQAGQGTVLRDGFVGGAYWRARAEQGPQGDVSVYSLQTPSDLRLFLISSRFRHISHPPPPPANVHQPWIHH